ncbi:uncharacterized protein TNCV_4355561 [Trichonephila clavipes]|nr:uncharacterized protein TNCV_4355561 [Trichonephila clavipes]
MPPNTLRVDTEYLLVKSVGPKVLWAESRVQRAGEYFPPLQSHGKIVEMEIGDVTFFRLFGEFRRAMVLKAKTNDRRTSSPLPQ